MVDWRRSCTTPNLQPAAAVSINIIEALFILCFYYCPCDEPPCCSVCRGVFNQGYLCSKCGLGAHKECLGRFGSCGKTGNTPTAPHTQIQPSLLCRVMALYCSASYQSHPMCNKAARRSLSQPDIKSNCTNATARLGLREPDDRRHVTAHKAADARAAHVTNCGFAALPLVTLWKGSGKKKIRGNGTAGIRRFALNR